MGRHSRRSHRGALAFCLGAAGTLAAGATLLGTACGADKIPGPGSLTFTFDASSTTPGTDGSHPLPKGTPVPFDARTDGCTNLECFQVGCTLGGTTSVSGTVYDPAKRNPLYNVVVYVPNAPLSPIPTGPSCDTCNSLYSGDPLVAATTAADGTFTLKDVPVGLQIPLVVQVGKWRTQTVIPIVLPCKNTEIADKTLTLPKSRFEGDIPNIAISTGAADTLECLLVRVGIDRSEYGPGASSPGRVHIFQGAPTPEAGTVPDTNPSAPTSASSLWASTSDLSAFDIVLLSCQGEPTSVTAADQDALVAYTGAGGRVFASHYHYAWFDTGPFGADGLARWTPQNLAISNYAAAELVTTLPNGQPFPKGLALQKWLGVTGALTSGELDIVAPRFDAVVSAANAPSQAWLTSDTHSDFPGSTEYFSFNTPVNADGGAAGQCGRVVFSDIHVGAASSDYGNPSSNPASPRTVPTGCATGELSPQEKALEFMLFDLSSCVTPDSQPPPPPPPPPNK
jgi:hypothetical protein